jgi:hypothetical protein
VRPSRVRDRLGRSTSLRARVCLQSISCAPQQLHLCRSLRSSRTSSTTPALAMSIPLCSFTAARAWESGSCRSALPPTCFLLCLCRSNRRSRFCMQSCYSSSWTTLFAWAIVCKCWPSLHHDCFKPSSCYEMFGHMFFSVPSLPSVMLRNSRVPHALVFLWSLHPQFPLWHFALVCSAEAWAQFLPASGHGGPFSVHVSVIIPCTCSVFLWHRILIPACHPSPSVGSANAEITRGRLHSLFGLLLLLPLL